MNNGELQQLGPPRELYDQPANTFVAGFIGSPAMNLIEAPIEAAGDGKINLSLDGSLSLPCPSAYEVFERYAGRTVLLGLRPEAIIETPNAASIHAGHVPIRLPVEVTEPTGPDTLALLRLGASELTARLPAETGIRAGETADLAIDLSKTSLFDTKTGERLV